MAMSSRQLELERKKQKLAELRSNKKVAGQGRFTLLPNDISKANTVDTGRPSLPSRFLNQEVNDLLGAVGISPIVKQLDFDQDSDVKEDPSQAAKEATKSNVSNEPREIPKLGRCEIYQISIPPKEIMHFSKSVQTDDFEQKLLSCHSEIIDETQCYDAPCKTSPEKSPSDLFLESEKVELIETIPELSDLERKQILLKDDFGNFFQRAAKIIERAMNDENDILIDYTNESSIKQGFECSDFLNFRRTLVNVKTCTNRKVTAMDFSPAFPDLMAVSYGAIPNSCMETPSIIHLWSTRHKTLEGTFHSTSKITTMQFARFHPNLLVGGCYSGQICLWDNRVNKRTPILKSAMKQNYHTQAIYSMNMVGTQNAHEMVTASIDGKLCIWSFENLCEPIETKLLSSKNKRQVSVFDISFLRNATKFCAGGEDGYLYLGDRHEEKGELMPITTQAHMGPVSRIEMHRCSGKVFDFSNCCLSSSFDGSIKIWNESTPLMTIDAHKNYVLDAKWSPVHPAVFATADSSGKINLWNLNSHTDAPIFSLILENRTPMKMIWDRDGKQLAIGCSDGQTLLYGAHDDLYNVAPDEWSKMSKVLKDLRWMPKKPEADSLFSC